MSRPVGLAAFWGLVATLSLSPLSSLQAKDLVVVQVAAQSGPQGVSGRAIGAGAKLYFDHINANGGIDGATIRLITHDDALKPEETVRLVRESIAHESPVAFLGMTGGNNVEAVVRDGALARNNIPLVGAVPFTPVIGKPSIFTIKASHSSELEHLFSHLSQLGMTTVGVVHQEDSLGNDIANSSKSAATRLGIKLVAICPYERNTTQVGAAVETMLKAKPMSIFLGMPTKGAIEFIKQYRLRGGVSYIFVLSIF